MIKNLLLCMTLAMATASSFAQSAAAMTRVAPASGPDGAASAPPVGRAVELLQEAAAQSAGRRSAS